MSKGILIGLALATLGRGGIFLIRALAESHRQQRELEIFRATLAAWPDGVLNGRP